MPCSRSLLALVLLALPAAPLWAQAPSSIPPVDRRTEVRTLNTEVSFARPASRDAWLQRARLLREQVLVSAGLWPLPEKHALNAQLSGRLERGGYSVEKVIFESHPGFYVTGNLYRPLGKTGPFPAVLSPHGHWPYGRLENSATGSIPARCITLARQGFVVFSYDMVGYNDSRQVDHRLLEPRLAQWGIGSLSLHLWNSIRSLDFLESLPDVDRTRLVATGASGGATQVFLLAAVDDRLAASAPVNMISHTMQGGDVCENAPNLRLDTNNMEIGALMAPKPMLMVSATGDWTRDTPRVEYPAVRTVYELLGAPDKVATVQFDADHNYNQDSREAVYGWFARWALGRADATRIEEPEYDPELLPDLLLFHGRALPAGAKTQQQVADALIEARKAQLAALRPRDAAGLRHFRERMRPGLRHALAAELPAAADVLESRAPGRSGNDGQDWLLGRRGQGDRVPVRTWPARGRAAGVVLVVDAGGIAGASGRSASLLEPLRRSGWTVASLDAFNTGDARVQRDTSDRFFTTYNRTDDANRVQDVLTALAWLQGRNRRVALVGLERAGLWCLLAQALAPGLEAVVADADGFPSERDEAYLGQVSIPLLRSVGGFETALMLGLGGRLLVQGTAGAFETTAAEASAAAAAAPGRLRVSPERVGDDEVVRWLTRRE